MVNFGKYVTQGHWSSKWHSDSRVLLSPLYCLFTAIDNTCTDASLPRTSLDFWDGLCFISQNLLRRFPAVPIIVLILSTDNYKPTFYPPALLSNS